MSDNIDKKMLREIVEQMVEQCLDEAIRRDMYIERVIDVAKGAMGEYFKARYAEANGPRRRSGVLGTQQGWDREVDHRIQFNFKQAVGRTLKGGDRRKAKDEAMSDLRAMVPSFLAYARIKVAEAFGIDPDDMVDPTDDPTDEFFSRLENAFDEATG